MTTDDIKQLAKKWGKAMTKIADEKRDNNQVNRIKDRPGCVTINGSLICYCGKCEYEDYKLPNDY